MFALWAMPECAHSQIVRNRRISETFLWRIDTFFIQGAEIRQRHYMSSLSSGSRAAMELNIGYIYNSSEFYSKLNYRILTGRLK